MQIEIHNKEELAVRSDVHRRRKIAERRFANDAVVVRRILPN